MVVEDDCLGGNGECTGTGVDAACEYPLVPGEACVYNANPNVDFCYGDELTYCADDGFADTSEIVSDRAHRVRVDAGVIDLPEDQRSRVSVKSVNPHTVSVRMTPGSLPG